MKRTSLSKSTYKKSYETKLLDKKFSAEEVEHILSLPSYLHVTKNISTYYDELKPLFSHDQIIAITSSYEVNGIKTLLDMAKEFLLTSPFNLDQICSIYCNSGTKSLAAACKHAQALLSFGLDLDQIIKIATNPNGCTNILTLHNYLEMIKLLKVPPKKITELLTSTNGFQKLKNYIDSLSDQIESEIEREGRELAESNCDNSSIAMITTFLNSLSEPPQITEPKAKRLRLETDLLAPTSEDDTFKFPVPEFEPQLDEVTWYKKSMPGDWAARFFQGSARILVEEEKTVSNKKQHTGNSLSR